VNDPKKPTQSKDPNNKNSQGSADTDRAPVAPTDTPKPASAAATNTQRPTQTSGPRHSFSWLFLLLWVVLASATAAGGGWLWQQMQALNSAQVAQLDPMLASQRELARQLQNLEQVVRTEQRERAALTEHMAALQAEIVALEQQASPARREIDPIISEVEFLLRSARHIGLLTGDLNRVEALLEQSNQLLQDTQRLAFLPIREALTQDLERVRSLPRTDLDDLYFRLGALAQDTQHWQWWPTDRLGASDPVTAETRPEGWQALWFELRDLVRIHERAEQRFETLDAASFEQAKNQYRLFLLQAQAALLQGQQAVYEASLSQAMAWLASFRDELAQHDRLQAQLQTLKAESIVRLTPDVNGALSRLQQLQRGLGAAEDPS